MATKSSQKKPTAKRGRPAKSSAKTSTRKRRQSKKQKQADVARRWSIVMFALGAVITAMSFVQGEKFWAFLRENFLFGVFGFSSYLIGPVLIYIGCLTLGNRPVKMKLIWAFGFILLVSSFVHTFFVGDIAAQTIPEIAKALHALGKSTTTSGGVMAGLIALPLLRLFGATAAKICITVLTLAFFMFLMDITLGDIVGGIAGFFSKAMDDEREDKALKRENRELKKDNKKLEDANKKKQEMMRLEEENRKYRQEQKRLQEEAEILEKTKPRVYFNIDVPLDDEPVKPKKAKKVEKVELPVEEDIIIPGPQTQDGFSTIFDEIKEEKAEKQHNVEEIMRKLNMSKAASNPAPVVTEEPEAVVEKAPEVKTLTDMEKAANTLTREEKAAIKPLSDEYSENGEKPYVYKNPPLSLFQRPQNKNYGDGEQELVNNAKKLVDTLASFGVQTEIIDYSKGPAVTRYELRPLAGVKVSKITNLADDIALNLATSGVRIEAPIPGKAAVGIEVPNKKGSSVNIRSLFESNEFKNSTSPLTIALGEDISGHVVTADLTRMPHLLIAGSTGSGKSVCVNSIIISFLYKSSPEDVKLILIDPKVVELAEYNGIPHLMMPVVTEPKKAAGALGGAVAEMEKRYRLFAENSVRDIKSFNKLAKEKPELNLEKMPYIAVIIDELADLMMVSGKEVEDYICRLAQKARAAGIHLVVATQRPSVDVITGLIKANIPARIAFAVSSQVDSRTILDGSGAEKLLGMGDMLFLPLGANKPTRVQGTFVRDEEISAVIDFVKKDFTAEYNQEMIDNMEKYATKDKGQAAASDDSDGDEDRDEMLPKAVETVVEAGQASTSLLQRKLKLGYARAARIMDQMEEMGVVGPYEGSKPRQVLITKAQWQEMVLSQGE